MIEILILRLKPGMKDKFHQLYITVALPLLRNWKFEMIGYGPSLHEEDCYYVIRSFKSLADRQQREDAYYNSDDWQKGPRAAILAMVEHYSSVVVAAETLGEWMGMVKK